MYELICVIMRSCLLHDNLTGICVVLSDAYNNTMATLLMCHCYCRHVEVLASFTKSDYFRLFCSNVTVQWQPVAPHAVTYNCLVGCRTNFDCDNLETFLTCLGGGGKFRGKMEKGVQNPYSCLVLAGARSMDERRAALQVT